MQLHVYIIIKAYLTGDDIPKGKKDLPTHIIRQFAAKWKRLGIELGLKDYDIANISENNGHHPRRMKVCFVDMIEQWLKENPFPTWGKLDDAINKIRSSGVESYRHTSKDIINNFNKFQVQVYSYIRTYIIM